MALATLAADPGHSAVAVNRGQPAGRNNGRLPGFLEQAPARPRRPGCLVAHRQERTHAAGQTVSVVPLIEFTGVCIHIVFVGTFRPLPESPQLF